ncbi:MAG: hypothetical protein LBE97_02765 [Holosporales bacterium]|jgi:hypothetical protein|nr:hypothetical protein [Holosporales bacterium]
MKANIKKISSIAATIMATGSLCPQTQAMDHFRFLHVPIVQDPDLFVEVAPEFLPDLPPPGFVQATWINLRHYQAPRVIPFTDVADGFGSGLSIVIFILGQALDSDTAAFRPHSLDTIFRLIERNRPTPQTMNVLQQAVSYFLPQDPQAHIPTMTEIQGNPAGLHYFKAIEETLLFLLINDGMYPIHQACLAHPATFQLLTNNGQRAAPIDSGQQLFESLKSADSRLFPLPPPPPEVFA